MTRKEAITVLNMIEAHGSLAIQAKDMAINALKERKAGHWIDHQDGRWIYAKCSECGKVQDAKSNFCPYCGVDMREEEEGVEQ